MTARDRFLAKAGHVASIGLALAGAVSLCVFVRFVYVGLTAQRQFSTGREIVIYYLLPATVTVLLFASLRLTPILRLRLLTAGVALTASMYAVELFLAFNEGQSKTFYTVDGQPQLMPVMTFLADSRDKKKSAEELTRTSGRPVDIRTSGEVLAGLRKTGIDAIRIVTPANHLFVSQPDGRVNSAITIDGHEVMPLAGVANRATLLCNENGQWVDYHSDRRGFNNPDEVWQARHLDVAALGDSFTHGYCVPRHQNFVDLIRQRGIATLNLAIAGHGPLLMLATLKEYLPALAPKIVLWFYYEGNDLINLQTERRSALLRRYLTDDFVQPELARQREVDRAILAEIPRLDAEEQGLAERRRRKPPMFGLLDSAKLTAIRERLAPLANSDPQVQAVAADFATANMEVFRETLNQAKIRTEAWNGHFYFVYLPEWSRYTGFSSWGKARRQEVLQLVSHLGIPIIDIDPVFQAHGDPLSLFPFRGVGHYNEVGHRLVASEVVRHLTERDEDGSD